MCTVASLHTLHTDLLVDMFKKIWNISFIIVDYYHSHQTFKCRLTHSSCIPTIFKESEVKWARVGGGGVRLFERGACLILLPRGWVLIEGKALFRARFELIPRKSFLNLFCVMLKA